LNFNELKELELGSGHSPLIELSETMLLSL